MDSLSCRRALEFVKKKHRGQFRADKVPAWNHLAHVSLLLSFILGKHGEGKLAERNIIALAALGHDILEDTKATKKEVKKIFGERGLTLIEGMTNTWGDDHPEAYVAKMRKNEEAVRLIKLSDLCDNVTSAAYHFNSLGHRWTVTYFLPIVSPMWRMIRKTEFKTYPKSAAEFVVLIENAMMLLEWEVEKASSK